MMNRFSGAVIVIAVLASSACDETLRDVAGPTPNLQPTFSSIQREIFNARDSSGRAACIECHNAVGREFAAGMSLAAGVAYSELVNRASRDNPGAIRVIPGDPERSYLIHKLEGRPTIVGERMPRGAGPYLTPGQISVIRRWIELGALND
jgi:hypothetical protein